MTDLAEPLVEAPVVATAPDRVADAALVLVTLPTGVLPSGSRRRLGVPRGIERLLGVVAFFALWETAARVGWLDPHTLAGPSTVLTVGKDLVVDGTLPHALWASLQRVLWGLGFGIPIGVGLALVAGLTRLGEDLVDNNVQMLRFVPIIALSPLLILWEGVGESTKVTMIAIGVSLTIYMNTHAAIRSIDPGHHELARVVGLGRRQRIGRIVLPGALPGFFVGLRLAVSIAWLLLVFAEQINASTGLGYLISKAQLLSQTDRIVVCIVVYAVLGLASDALVRTLERRVLRWQPGR
ncbi:MAG: binding-protein-dependent transport system inner rane component [Acidimicrobiales bacterium]|nr:binding-protein-dependent transport system inner rane component [Acidimicrobiales bacterium]